MDRYTSFLMVLFLLVITNIFCSYGENQYTKYVKEHDSLQLDCISDHDESQWNIVWMKMNIYKRTEKDTILSKNGHSLTSDRRVVINVHHITTKRKRYLLNIQDFSQNDEAAYYCLAVLNNITNNAEMIRQGEDLTGDIIIRVFFGPNPAEPECLKKPAVNGQITLQCCHGLARPFLTRMWMTNETRLYNTKDTEIGDKFCLEIDVSSGDIGTYQCVLISEAFTYYQKACEVSIGMITTNKPIISSPTPTTLADIRMKTTSKTNVSSPTLTTLSEIQTTINETIVSSTATSMLSEIGVVTMKSNDSAPMSLEISQKSSHITAWLVPFTIILSIIIAIVVGVYFYKKGYNQGKTIAHIRINSMDRI